MEKDITKKIIRNVRFNPPSTYHPLLSNRGFVLLFSLLISSILLATGLGISRIMVRQITLASLSRESQVALFAADSGLECALHWNVFGKFDPVDPTKYPDGKSQTIYCNREIIGDGIQTPEAANLSEAVKLYGNVTSCDATGEPPLVNIIKGKSKSCFVFSLPESSACAFVVVDKDPFNDSLGLTTRITSNGYNSCTLTAPNILQRTLQEDIVIKL